MTRLRGKGYLGGREKRGVVRGEKRGGCREGGWVGGGMRGLP